MIFFFVQNNTTNFLNQLLGLNFCINKENDNFIGFGNWLTRIISFLHQLDSIVEKGILTLGVQNSQLKEEHGNPHPLILQFPYLEKNPWIFCLPPPPSHVSKLRGWGTKKPTAIGSQHIRNKPAWLWIVKRLEILDAFYFRHFNYLLLLKFYNQYFVILVWERAMIFLIKKTAVIRSTVRSN